MIDVDRLHELIRETKLECVADQLVSLARPAIRIQPSRVKDEAELPIGASKLGGSPDLPPGFAWYEWQGRPLTFIAQFKLSEVAPYDAEKVLASKGMLYFFYEVDQQPWGFDPAHRGGARVLYLEDESLPLERVKHPTAKGEYRKIKSLRPCAVQFAQVITLPDWDTEEAEKVKLNDDEIDSYVELLDGLDTEGSLHQLLGWPHQIQGDMQLECQLASNGIYVGGPEGYRDPRAKQLKRGARDWRLLLQIDSHVPSSQPGLGITWGDAGCIYYWIQAQALQARDFDNCWLVLQCY